MNISDPFYILSAARDTLDAHEIKARTETLVHQVRGQGYGAALCEGRYGDVDEPSVVVVDETPGTDKCLKIVMRLARVYQQESILAVDVNGAARLLFLDGSKPLGIGKFTCVSENEAKRAAAYTKRNGRYYICVAVTS